MNFFCELERHADRVALVTDSLREIRYAELLHAADEIGRQIKKRSLVFVLCKNSFESLAGYLGFQRAGHVPVLLSATIEDSLLQRLLEAYRPRYLYRPAASPEGSAAYELVETSYADEIPLHPDLALLLTTSGSTGSPKFVRLSHKNLFSNARDIAASLAISSSDRAITTMPMSYSYGLSILHSHLLQGASILLTQSTLMEKRFWELVKNQHVTTFGGVPFIYEMLKKLHVERMDLAGVRYLTQAGGRLRPELCLEMAQICDQKNIQFIVMYGQTEATARMAYLPADQAGKKAGSIGIAIPNGEFWVEDSLGQRTEDLSGEGELVYRGDNVSMGYAESYEDLVKGDENQGVLRTGDLARRDAEGFFSITGRKKRFLKIFGHRVNLNEIEQLINAAGFECVCAGNDDKLKIFLTNIDEKSRVSTFVTQLTGLNASGFAFVGIEKIPRGESGKVLYSALDAL